MTYIEMGASEIKANIKVLEQNLFDSYKQQNELKKQIAKLEQDIHLLKSGKDKMQEMVSEVEVLEKDLKESDNHSNQRKMVCEEKEEKEKTAGVIIKHLVKDMERHMQQIQALDDKIKYNSAFFQKAFSEIKFWNEESTLDENILTLKKKITDLTIDSSAELSRFRAIEKKLKALENNNNAKLNELHAQIDSHYEESNSLIVKNVQLDEQLGKVCERTARMKRGLEHLIERTNLLNISIENRKSQKSQLPVRINPTNPRHQKVLETMKLLPFKIKSFPSRDKVEREVEELEFFYENALRAQKLASNFTNNE